ncbi:MAG: acetyl-CoA carboxylase biotin carboxylase subunit [Gammaproteobacteria bacterium]|nr:acetyl-CoA carboxylase biotin carboxylase subunit [Gammaproteobacteria bacterium]
MIKSILIANRGEIAVRIIRAARELGIETVQVHSQADANSMAVQMADHAVDIGPPQASKSYLNKDAILKAASDYKVDAVHPGYGFFAENPEFSDLVTNAGFIFIGPDGATIRKMGDKVAAREAADSAGVPTVPGTPGRIDDMAEARAIAEKIGFPVMIKAAAGGGGRGIRVVQNLEEFDQQAPEAGAEAHAAFGDGGLYLEKFIGSSRHIEVQILADGENAIHLYERECSLQRRRQKVWEEAPAINLPETIRTRLCEDAVKLARAVRYKGAGTVEYLYDDNTQEFYFIEMNTRIQVEHPISELITGIDIMREMIRIASGEKLALTQSDISIRGHAIEVRINAEDPFKDFMPFPGVVENVTLPGGPGVRFDGMIFPGYAIPPFYDSLLGKLIVWDSDRNSVLNRLKRALLEFEVSGLPTTKPLFEKLVENSDIQNCQFDTKWLENWLEKDSLNS